MRLSILLLTLILLSANALGTSDRLELLAERPTPQAIDLLDLQGKMHRLKNYRGDVVMVTFWATWCPQCIYEMPSLTSMWRQLSESGLILLAIDVDEQESVVRDYVTKNHLPFPVLLDNEMAAYKRWPVLGLPASYIIDRSGRIRYQSVGARDWDNPEILRQLKGLLNERP